MPKNFEDKTIIVTGAANGIGRATALLLAARGAQLMLVDRPGEALQSCADAAHAAGARAQTFGADLTAPGQVQAYVDATQQAFGNIDGLFNNAGILGPARPITEYPEDEFDRVLAINVKAAWMGVKCVAPALVRRGGGAIVNTASIAGLRGSPGLSGYTISKHALVGLTRGAAKELMPLRVRVNAVCPGPIETAMGQALDSGMNPQDPAAGHARVLSQIPAGRYGQASEVASLVAFLLSDESAYISGAVYPIDGAMTA